MTLGVLTQNNLISARLARDPLDRELQYEPMTDSNHYKLYGLNLAGDKDPNVLTIEGAFPEETTDL